MCSPNRIHVSLSGSVDEIFDTSNTRGASIAAFGPHSADVWNRADGARGKDTMFRVVSATDTRPFFKKLVCFGASSPTRVYQRVDRKPGNAMVVRSFFRIRGFHVSVIAEIAKNEAILSWDVTSAPSCYPWNEDEARATVEAVVSGRVARLAEALKTALPVNDIDDTYPDEDTEMS